MKSRTLATVALLAAFGAGFLFHAWTDGTPPAKATQVAHDTGLALVKSPHSVGDTVNKLTTVITGKGLRVFAVIDHAANAKAAGLTLRPTTLVVFGNPKLGTPLMHKRATAGIDLPQKMLVWRDAASKQTWIAYNRIDYLNSRHRLGNPPQLAKVKGALAAFAAAAASK